MTINIMEEYLDIVTRKINKYFKLVFENKFNKKICEEYINSYINIRYNNYSSLEEDDEINKGLTLRKRILRIMQMTEEKLLKKYPEHIELVKNMHVFFYYVLYFDNVVYYKDIYKKIDDLYKLRIKILKKENEKFKDELKNLLNEFDEEEKALYKKFESKEFELKISEYTKRNVYRVNLKANIRFPEIYSDESIRKAFNTGLVKEEKLYIEYYLISLKIINDLKKLNFKKQYIVEFADSLFNKDKKIKGILNIIDTPYIQDKLNLKIRYQKYLENKKKVEKLIKDGYHIAVILDDTFEITNYNIQKLDIFSYILLNRSLDKYEEIMKNVNSINNIIEV